MHKWIPCHRETVKRSHVDKTIVLLKIGDRYVPIVESAMEVVTQEKEEEHGLGARAKSCEPEQQETFM